MSSYGMMLNIPASTDRLRAIKQRNLQLSSMYQLHVGLRSHLPLLSRTRFPPEAPWMCHVWPCFPSFSSSWSPWGFGTCNRGSQPCLWEVLLTRGPFWAEQVCGVRVTPAPQPRERSTKSWEQTKLEVFTSHILVFHKTKGSNTLRWQVCFCSLESSFSAVRMYILIWVVWVCFSDRIKGSQGSRIRL